MIQAYLKILVISVKNVACLAMIKVALGIDFYSKISIDDDRTRVSKSVWCTNWCQDVEE